MKYAVYKPSDVIGKDEPQLLRKKHFMLAVERGEIERITSRVGRIVRYPSRTNPVDQILSSRQDWREEAEQAVPAMAGTCEICNFTICEQAHIIPARFNGPKRPSNLLQLCPNHHTLFDRNLLSWKDMQKIWPQVCVALVNAKDDVRLDEWRESLTARYGVSFDAS